MTQKKQHQTLYIKWKKAMEEAYNIAAKRSSRRKEQDIKREMHFFTQYCNLESRVLMRNLSENEATGKMHSY